MGQGVLLSGLLSIIKVKNKILIDSTKDSGRDEKSQYFEFADVGCKRKRVVK